MSTPSNPTDQFYSGAPDVILGYGAQFMIGVGDGSPETFVAAALVNEITIGGLTGAVIDVTHLRSLNRTREKRAGMLDTEAFGLKLRWLPGHQTHGFTAGNGSTTAPGLGYLSRNNDTPWNFRVVLNDGSPATEIGLTGMVTKYKPGTIQGDGAIDLEVEITPSESWDV